MNQYGTARNGCRCDGLGHVVRLEDGEELVAQLVVVLTDTVPFADDVGGGGIEPGHVVEPANAGVEGQVGGLRMVPGDMGSQAAHRHDPGEAAVNEQRAALFEQLDQALASGGGDIRKPRRLEFATAFLGKHGKHSFYGRPQGPEQDGNARAGPLIIPRSCNLEGAARQAQRD